MPIKNSYNDRELRLECIKLAATLSMQQKLSKGAAMELAEQFYQFVTKDDNHAEVHSR